MANPIANAATTPSLRVQPPGTLAQAQARRIRERQRRGEISIEKMNEQLGALQPQAPGPAPSLEEVQAELARKRGGKK